MSSQRKEERHQRLMAALNGHKASVGARKWVAQTEAEKRVERSQHFLSLIHQADSDKEHRFSTPPDTSLETSLEDKREEHNLSFRIQLGEPEARESKAKKDARIRSQKIIYAVQAHFAAKAAREWALKNKDKHDGDGSWLGTDQLLGLEFIFQLLKQLEDSLMKLGPEPDVEPAEPFEQDIEPSGILDIEPTVPVEQERGVGVEQQDEKPSELRHEPDFVRLDPDTDVSAPEEAPHDSFRDDEMDLINLSDDALVEPMLELEPSEHSADPIVLKEKPVDETLDTTMDTMATDTTVDSVTSMFADDEAGISAMFLSMKHEVTRNVSQLSDSDAHAYLLSLFTFLVAEFPMDAYSTTSDWVSTFFSDITTQDQDAGLSAMFNEILRCQESSSLSSQVD